MPDTTPDPAAGLPAGAAAAVARLNDLIDGKTPERPAPGHLERFTVQSCPAGKHADWAADSENTHACPWCEIERLHADRAAVRAAAIREAADAIEDASLARLDAIDEDDLCPSDQDTHQEWCDAATLLRRLTTAPTTTTTPEEH